MGCNTDIILVSFYSSNVQLTFDTLQQHLSAIASINTSISEVDVYNALINLDITKATGPDNIPPIVLSKCASVLCKPLHYLFSLSLKYGYLPTDWKIHKIIPIFKSGDPTLVKNYRPISLLSNTSKVLKRIIYDKIIDHEEPLHYTTAITISVQCLCFTPSVRHRVSGHN